MSLVAAKKDDKTDHNYMYIKKSIDTEVVEGTLFCAPPPFFFVWADQPKIDPPPSTAPHWSKQGPACSCL